MNTLCNAGPQQVPVRGWLSGQTGQEISYVTQSVHHCNLQA